MVVVNLGSRYTVLFNRRETFFDVAHITPGRLLLLNGTLTAFDFRFLNIGNSTWKAFLTYHVSFGMIIQIEDVKEVSVLSVVITVYASKCKKDAYI